MDKKIMKLVYCSVCGDVVRLIASSWRMCDCKSVGGQYNRDGMTATIGGFNTCVFGIANPFFDHLWLYLPEEQRIKFRKDNNYGPGDCWWGGFKGDTQLFFIENPEGPRLRVKVTAISSSTNQITVTDKRVYRIDGIESHSSVLVPSNPHPSFKARKKKEKNNEMG